LYRSKLAKRVAILLLLGFTGFYLYGLGKLPLIAPDEPRYAQVAREMLKAGGLITPTLGGYTWFEKPILLYWLAILSYKLLGVSEFSARLGAATAGILNFMAIYWLARKVERQSEDSELKDFSLWSLVVAATTLGTIVFSRAVSFDILVAATMTWALVFFFAWEIEAPGPKQKAFLVAFYVCVGLSLLAKGLIGFLPLATVATYFLIRWQVPRRQLLSSLFWGIPLSLAVASVWYGPAIFRHGTVFVDDFIVQHHFARYLSNKYNHPQPFVFYFVILVPLTLPWTPIFLNAICHARNWRWRSAKLIDRLRVFALAGLLLPTLFFSFSGSKLPGYIVPVLPLTSLLIGERLSCFVNTGVSTNWLRAMGVLHLLFAAGALLYARLSGMISLSCALAVVSPIIVTGLFVLLWTRLRIICASAIAGTTLLAVAILLNCGVSKIAGRESVKELIRAGDARGYSGLPILGLHLVERSVEFYAHSRVVYSANGQPAKFEGTAEILESEPARRGPVLVLVPLEHLDQLTSLRSAEIDVIEENGVLALVYLRKL